MATNTKNANNKSSRAGEIATITGIAAASVAAYMFLGPGGKKHRKTAEDWGRKVQKEVVDKMKKVKNLSEPVYHEIVDAVSEKYGSLKNIDREELALAINQLRKGWSHIVKVKKNAPRRTKAAKTTKTKRATTKRASGK